MRLVAGVATVLRWAFFLLLMASSIGKLLDMAGFIKVVETYQSLPPTVTPAAAWGLVTAELVLAIWLATGSALQRCALAIVALHAMYFVWIGVALFRGLSLANCGCFGVYLARPLTVWTLLEDGILLLLALFLWRNSGQH